MPKETRDEYVDIIIERSQQLAELSSNILELTKLENTGILDAADKETFFLDEQVRRAAALFEPKWREKNISVDFEMQRIEICSNAELLQQAWVNLIDNAVKFTPVGGDILITLEEESGMVVLKIADNGIGMDETTKNHLFDRFYQGDQSHSHTGSGLGLALVKRILTLCGGGISVESEPGQGSIFTASLPL